MASTTALDVRNAFIRTVSAARAVGLNPAPWRLVEGGRTYGTAFRIVALDPSNGVQYTPCGLWSTYLGMSRREAIATLDGMRSAWLSIADRVTS